MRKHRFWLSIIGFYIGAVGVSAQTLIKCDTTHAFWVLHKDSAQFAIKISGNALETEKKSLISVDKRPLQALISEKSGFVKTEEDNSEMKILVRYASKEAEFYAKQFKTKVNIQMQQAPFGNDQIAVIWTFDMPEGYNKEVRKQVFVNVVQGDKIIGLSSSLFVDDQEKVIKDFLMDCISTLKKTTKTEVANLCLKK